MAEGANPAVLLLGDSWLWYPFGNLAVEIGAALPREQFLVIGTNGLEAAEWASKGRKYIDFAFEQYAPTARALVVSGGGNDIAGMADFLQLVADDCSRARTVEQCYRSGQPDAKLIAIVAAYAAVIAKFRAYNRSATVLTHNYDDAWPTGKGVFGPADWLKAAMDRASVPQRLRRALLRDLLRRLRLAQLALAADAGVRPIECLATAGTLPDNERIWANELHPTPSGFRMLARQRFVPALEAILGARQRKRRKRAS